MKVDRVVHQSQLSAGILPVSVLLALRSGASGGVGSGGTTEGSASAGGSHWIVKAELVNAAMHLYAAPGELGRVYDENCHGDFVAVRHEVVGKHGDATLFRLVNAPRAQIRVEVEILSVTLSSNVCVQPGQNVSSVIAGAVGGHSFYSETAGPGGELGARDGPGVSHC